MPLVKSGSKAAISENIRREKSTGKSQRQSVAIALSTARKYGRGKYAEGGAPWYVKQEARSLARSGQGQGLLKSTVPGRTDKLPMDVANGSYVIPGDTVSALGQGNTLAGGEILNQMFKTGPLGMKPMSGRTGASRRTTTRMPKGSKISFKADGGAADIPIVAAGGEFIVSPDAVAMIGDGDVKRGHSVLDAFVLQIRKEHIKTLRGLKPPKKD